MPCDLNGTWRTVQVEGSDELLTKIGVTSPDMFAAAKSSTEVLLIEGSKISVTMKIGDKVVKELSYTLDEEFEDLDPAGGKWKCLAKWEGDVLKVDASNESNGWKMSVSRDIQNSEMVVKRTLDFGDGQLVSTGKFQRI